MDEPSEYIDFIARYRDWIAIKKMSIREDTKPQEIAFHLAGIRDSFNKRLFSMLEIKTAVLDEFSSKIAKGKKDYGSLAEAINILDSKEAKEAIAGSCDKKVAKIAKVYLMNKIINDSGFDTLVTQQIISKAYPPH